MQPRCVEQLASDSCLHAVGVPEQVPVPADQVQPFVGRQVALLLFAAHGFDVPVQVPVPAIHVQPFAVRQVVLDAFVAHAVGVPVHVAVVDQKQPAPEVQVALLVFAEQGVEVPEQLPVAADQMHPVPVTQVALLVRVVHAVGVPVHAAAVYVQPLAWHGVMDVLAAQVVVGVPEQTRFKESHAQPGWYVQLVTLVRVAQSVGVPVHVAAA